MEITNCLNRMLGKCKGCAPDLDESHHPNNLDCPMFKPVKMIVIEVVEKEKVEDVDLRRLRM